MIELSKISQQLVFVCYEAGAGGERLSVNISAFPGFRKLNCYLTESNRTIITNDIFEKIFLFCAGPFERLVESVRGLDKDVEPDTLYVTPSHWDVAYLEPIFPCSRFIRIISPSQEIIEVSRERIWNTTFSNFLEFAGYCKIYLTDQEFKDYLIDKKIRHTMSVRQINQVIEKEIKRSQTCQFKYRQVIDKPNILNVPYNSFEEYRESIQNFLDKKHQ